MARLELRAAELGQSHTTFVTRALEKALDGVGSDQPTGGKTTEVPATAAPLPARPAPSRASELRCPTPGCGVRSKKPGARCLTHDAALT